MKLRRILLAVALAFVVYYILHNPAHAGKALQLVGRSALRGVKSLAKSLTRFFDSLFS